MWQFLRILGKTAPSLTVAVLLASAFQIQVAPAAANSRPGSLILAQAAAPCKEKEAAEAARARKGIEMKKMQKARKPEVQMERSHKPSAAPPPAAAGTRKIGGQTIRDKETPEGE
jgi:hypothetical protein